MDLNGREAKTKPLVSSLKSHKEGIVERILGNKEMDDESKRLLSPRPRSNGISNGTLETKRKVQWNDTNGGNKLAEVLEFLPSDVSESDDDDELDSCFCTIM